MCAGVAGATRLWSGADSSRTDMSEQESTKGPFSSAFMGVVIVIGTVVVVGGIFVFALISGASHGAEGGGHGADTNATAPAEH